ncbi:hypothetical protein [Pseudomonas chlororaphis]|uniref:hypothetical protein n=1 Tax=Pseudomonas chlororaphis TaxID=587753 RepID=UPI000F562A85|nr:hypothetical protein [Pseudomonas chlororaphis]WDG75469.1 hypothetical protein PUP65_14180 [Pseudomonas chlororaphis]WDH26895.1 hypothetical protein PUP81_20130 [Pseudomonas chlororaphis]WDH73989.1 hypothetical protein PUP78_14175 [Pseudomonas chlororaphis]
MKNTFINKVSVEREVLRSVNFYTRGARQLAGLSWSAIDAWQRAVSMPGIESLVRELKELSDLCQRLSDRSHETFEPLDPTLYQTLQSRIAQLNEHLRSAEQNLRYVSN